MHLGCCNYDYRLPHTCLQLFRSLLLLAHWFLAGASGGPLSLALVAFLPSPPPPSGCIRPSHPRWSVARRVV
ncbi:uncharacterized protein BKA78DRAFT_323656 [Phyllosticta capitalensis]|uniref:uncharacterized protein n=1 Tax=Phyllosticta capitalensis TaxID=121624 RepID=UPI003131B856